MESWQIDELEVDRHHPQVLASDDEGRAIVLELPAGERLGEHQVHERAWLLVVSGAVEISEPGGEPSPAAPGCSPSSTPTSATRSPRPRTRACCSCSRRGRARATPRTRSA